MRRCPFRGFAPLSRDDDPVWAPEVEKDGAVYLDDENGATACPQGHAIMAAEAANQLQLARDFPGAFGSPATWPASTTEIYLALRRAEWVK